jgi:hypothetical protein
MLLVEAFLLRLFEAAERRVRQILVGSRAFPVRQYPLVKVVSESSLPVRVFTDK